MPPRTFSLKQHQYHSVHPPRWMIEHSDERFGSQYQDNELLMAKGEIALAYLVQANVLLFKQGSEDCPAAIIYSLDPFFEDHVGELRTIAELLYGMKGKHKVPKGLKSFADSITNEYTALLNQEIPRISTAGRQVYYTCLMVHRKHIPEGRIIGSWFPLLTLPRATTATMILPADYWPESMVEEWTAG